MSFNVATKQTTRPPGRNPTTNGLLALRTVSFDSPPPRSPGVFPKSLLLERLGRRDHGPHPIRRPRGLHRLPPTPDPPRIRMPQTSRALHRPVRYLHPPRLTRALGRHPSHAPPTQRSSTRPPFPLGRFPLGTCRLVALRRPTPRWRGALRTLRPRPIA